MRFRWGPRVGAFVWSWILLGCWLNSPVAAQPEPFRLELLSGSSLRARIASVSETGQVSGPGVPAGLTWNQIVSVRMVSQDPSERSGPRLEMATGGRLGYETLALTDERLSLTGILGPLQLPLEAIRGVTFRETPRGVELLRSRSTEQDLVLVSTGSRQREVPGILEQINATHVTINYEGRSRRIGLDKVDAIITADLELTPQSGTMTSILLGDGSQVSGRLDSWAEGVLRLTCLGNAALAIPLNSVQQIQVRSDSLRYLSDLEPLEIEERAEFAVHRDWQRDRSVTGAPLQLGFADSQRQATYAKGLGVKSFSRLVFAKPDGFKQFRATVGIAVETEGRGDCQLELLGDGISLWSARVKGGDNPVPVSVDVSQIDQLELRVEPGVQFDLADHANWCEARFLKSP